MFCLTLCIFVLKSANQINNWRTVWPITGQHLVHDFCQFMVWLRFARQSETWNNASNMTYDALVRHLVVYFMLSHILPLYLSNAAWEGVLLYGISSQIRCGHSAEDHLAVMTVSITARPQSLFLQQFTVIRTVIIKTLWFVFFSFLMIYWSPLTQIANSTRLTVFKWRDNNNNKNTALPKQPAQEIPADFVFILFSVWTAY